MLLGVFGGPGFLFAVDDELAVFAVLDVAVEFGSEGEAKVFGDFFLDCAITIVSGVEWRWPG